MKRILILNAGDFDGDNKSLSSLKKPNKNLESDFDDIFFFDKGEITCFKARSNKCGNYSIEEFNKYILN
ncbi:MAG: hypothetical protein AAB257_07120 [Nitrospinota bacterium]|jgi:hypothetical protein